VITLEASGGPITKHRHSRLNIVAFAPSKLTDEADRFTPVVRGTEYLLQRFQC
jgi:hypothetical protein